MYICCVFCYRLVVFLFFNDTATTEIYTLSLHDALPILAARARVRPAVAGAELHYDVDVDRTDRSEEHTSELQSRFDLVCRLLLEKKKTIHIAANDSITSYYPQCPSDNTSTTYIHHSKSS